MKTMMAPTEATIRDEAAMHNQGILVVSGVTKVYQMGEAQVHALRGVDLSLAAGELVVLLGPSGSGKSTLLNLMGGLDVPTAGRVLYGDRDLTAADDTELTPYRRAHVGFVFQFYSLVPALMARENVAIVTDLADSAIRHASFRSGDA